jgi:hypothetical protein
MVQPTFCPEKTSSRTFERSGSCPKFMTGGRPITIPALVDHQLAVACQQAPE